MSGRDLDELYERQQEYREHERAAVDEAVDAPVEEARQRLADLAAKQQEWIAEQRRLLRERVKQQQTTGRAAARLAQVGRDVAQNRGWSL